MSYSKIMILGRLGKDPETKASNSGTAICKFSVATDKNKKNSSGQWEKVTQWHNCICFGKTAEIANQYLKKGRQVFIEGEIDYQEYEKDGVKKYFTQILVSHLTFIGSDKEEKEAKNDYSDIMPKMDDNSNFGGINYDKRRELYRQLDFQEHDDIPF